MRDLIKITSKDGFTPIVSEKSVIPNSWFRGRGGVTAHIFHDPQGARERRAGHETREGRRGGAHVLGNVQAVGVEFA